jgi:hypothetical protein
MADAPMRIATYGLDSTGQSLTKDHYSQVDLPSAVSKR